MLGMSEKPSLILHRSGDFFASARGVSHQQVMIPARLGKMPSGLHIGA